MANICFKSKVKIGILLVNIFERFFLRQNLITKENLNPKFCGVVSNIESYHFLGWTPYFWYVVHT